MNQAEKCARLQCAYDPNSDPLAAPPPEAETRMCDFKIERAV